MSIKVLCLGEIVGKAGINCLKQNLKKVQQENNIDFVIANGDGTTGGFGIGKNHSIALNKRGIDVITGGDCLFFKKDMVQHISRAPYILRPANYPPGVPGRGWKIFSKDNFKIGVVSMMGLSGYTRTHLNNPFTYFPEIVKRIKEETNIIFLDFHASTSAEKKTMGFMANGTTSAVIGTGFKVQTADEIILSKGTAYITDTGRTGSSLSVGGLNPDIEIQKFLTQIPERSKETFALPELQGVIVEVDETTGKALSIERIKVPCKEMVNE